MFKQKPISDEKKGNDAVRSYWTRAHKIYSEKEFITKSTLFAEEVLEYFPHSETFLDLGAGQGQDSRFFARNGFNVTSADLTPYALEVAKKFAEKEDLSLTFKEVDIACPLPFDDETFGVVYSHLALHYFNKETTTRMFSEIHRILKSDGIFATLLNTVEDPEIERDDFEKIEEDFYRTPEGIYKRFFSVESLGDFTKNYFVQILLDDKGQTYKDEIKTLIRFVGKKK